MPSQVCGGDGAAGTASHDEVGFVPIPTEIEIVDGFAQDGREGVGKSELAEIVVTTGHIRGIEGGHRARFGREGENTLVDAIGGPMGVGAGLGQDRERKGQ